LVRQAHKENFPFGLYHVAGAGQTNWHSYAKYVIDRARQSGWPIRVTSDAIRAIATSDYPSPTKRPVNSCLDSTKLRNTFGLHVPEWQAGVDYILDQIFDIKP
jgi:dTDP-4-dehydrorhamnose reductase